MTYPADPGRPSEADLLARAVRLAVDNVAAGQAPFGALVVLDGEVVATGVTTADHDSDPIAHAEVEAVRAACRRLGRRDHRGRGRGRGRDRRDLRFEWGDVVRAGRPGAAVVRRGRWGIGVAGA